MWSGRDWPRRRRRPCPSSLRGRRAAAGSGSRTRSDGRQSRTRFELTTIGRVRQDRVCLDGVEELRIRQAFSGQPEIGMGGAFLPQDCPDGDSHARHERLDHRAAARAEEQHVEHARSSPPRRAGGGLPYFGRRDRCGGGTGRRLPEPRSSAEAYRADCSGVGGILFWVAGTGERGDGWRADVRVLLAAVAHQERDETRQRRNDEPSVPS